MREKTQRVTASRAGRGVPGSGQFGVDEITRRDEAGLKGLPRELRALLVLRQILDVEHFAESPEIRLDRVDAHEQLLGDRFVGRRRAMGVLRSGRQRATSTRR